MRIHTRVGDRSAVSFRGWILLPLLLPAVLIYATVYGILALIAAIRRDRRRRAWMRERGLS